MTTYNNSYISKQLYSCKATVNKQGLVSYNTRIVDIEDNNIKMHLVHTPTTMQHTRKYVQYLTECGEHELADIVYGLYRMCITRRAQDAMYDKEKDKFIVIA